jgi:hypothetical protein
MIDTKKKIADKEIIFTDTFIIPDNETVEFSFAPDYPDGLPTVVPTNALVHVKLKCGTDNDVVNAQWGRENGTHFVTITLPETKNRLGAGTLTKPMKIGQVAGLNLGFYAAISSSGNGSLVTVQFVQGGNYE